MIELVGVLRVMLGMRVCRPSMAETTEMAGVSTPSPMMRPTPSTTANMRHPWVNLCEMNLWRQSCLHDREHTSPVKQCRTNSLYIHHLAASCRAGASNDLYLLTGCWLMQLGGTRVSCASFGIPMNTLTGKYQTLEFAERRSITIIPI